MFKKIVDIVKKNWIFVVLAIAIMILMMMFSNKGNFIDRELTGCSTCSTGDAGVLFDTELSGCSTCSTGDAGVLLDTEMSDTEIYNMPDDYYSSPQEIADTVAEVAHNPDEFAAVVEDREDNDDIIIDPTDYAAQSDEQLVADFYGDNENDYWGDSEIDHAERERVHKIRFMPLDMDASDGTFTLL
jgi:hypothetical protein